MVHWRGEKGRSSARGQWAPDASRRNVEIGLYVERVGQGAYNVSIAEKPNVICTRTCQLLPASFSSSRSRSFSLCLPLLHGVVSTCPAVGRVPKRN